MKVAGIGDNVIDRYMNMGVMFPGGKAVNVAAHASRLGAQAAYVGSIGADREGRIIREALTALNVDLSQCMFHEDSTTKKCDVNVYDGERDYIGADEGKNWVHTIRIRDCDVDYLRRFDVVHTSCNAKLHKDVHKLQDLSFVLHKGEILGFGGLVGAGRTELMRAIMGLDKASGTIYKNGKVIVNHNPTEAIRNKFALVPEDRKDQGLVLLLSILKNIEMSSLRELSSGGFMNSQKEKDCAAEYMKRLQVKAADAGQAAGDLSGGNQQKVVIAKCLATKPDILILDEPTRGIDVGSKAEIYEIMNQLVLQGVSIIMISSELPELLNMSDRIIIMREGKITGEQAMGEATEETVMKLATKEAV